MIETIWDRNNLASNASTNPYPKTVFTSIKSGSSYVKTSIKDYKYDKNGNVTRVAEYDWVNYGDVPRSFGMPTGLPAVSPTRVTVNTFFNPTPDATQFAGSDTDVYWSSGSPRVKNAIASTEIRKIVSGVEQTVSRAEYVYDNASAPANMTEARTWDSTKGAYSNPLTSSNWLLATTQYNQYGMPTLVTDPRGLKTLSTYGAIGSVSDLYPTQIKTAYQTAQERTETREYHLATGLVTKVTDADNNVSTVTTFDALGRPTLVKAAETSAEETHTAYEYADAQRRVITRSDLTTVGDGKLVSIQHYDQLGRVRLSRQLEDAAAQSATDETTGIKVQTRYRFSGSNSFLLVSNAYRAATSGAATAEQTMGWTRNKSDNAGRIIEVQTFGGASLPAPWASNSTSTGTVTTAYDANFTTVSDQTQKQRRSVSDALGRLIRVDEPDLNGNLGSTTAPTQPTHYAYDVLGNLTEVSQSDGTTTQLRSFIYSSLSRLTQATNPESGTINYQYDESGNLLVRTDARLASTHYSYDALNRITRRWYNGSTSLTATTHNSPALPAGVGATSETKFYYDTQSLPGGAPSYSRGSAVGRLVAQTYGSGTSGDYFAYDVLGRPTLKIQQTGAVNYQMSATYNLSGAITTLTYPSGRAITNTYDPAARLTGVSGNLGDGATRIYSTGILYSPLGGLVKEQFGTTTPIYNKRFYNSRGQLAEIRESTSYTGPTDTTWDRGAIINNYSASCTGVCSGSSMTDNNGNLRKQEIHIPSQTMRWQEYDYDSLNRLNWAREVLNGGAEQWKQAFTYDRWGNRTINPATTYGTGINNNAFIVITASNRLGVPGGQIGVMSYDDAGNLTTDTYSGAGNRTYDAENKITEAADNTGQISRYIYDGEGKRVRRQVASSQEMWQVYGFGGELLAEYRGGVPAIGPEKEYGYRNGELLVTATGRLNVALAANGGVATASSAHTCCGFSTTGAINGNFRGPCGNGEGWNDATENVVPDWIQVDFAGSKTIDEISVFSLHDNYTQENNPTLTQTFLLYGLVSFNVQYWDGSTWVTIPGGSVTGNNKVWRNFTFSPITTNKIRVFINTVPDAWSRVVEIQAFGTSAGNEKVQWLVSDHLGTPRMVFDLSGALGSMKRHDYLPFGEELFAPTGGRSNAQGYTGGDGVRQQFTQKERDVETGLDYFDARYYSSIQGRFTGVDPAGPDLANPQTLNKYQYCLNNPLAKVDRNGRYEEDVHRDLTYALAMAAGFNAKSARSIADANQGVDDNPATSPMGMSPVGESVEVRRLYHFTTEGRRNELWGKFELSNSLSDLGVFFHAQQDSFSHETYGPRLGHLKDGHAPDKTFERPGRADVMALDTFNRMKTGLSRLVTYGKETVHYDAVQWKTIAPMVEAFNRARTAKEKQEIIKRLVNLVQKEHRRQDPQRIKNLKVKAAIEAQNKAKK